MAASVAAPEGVGPTSEHLLEALEQVAGALADRRAWESGHTTIFELLRRSCLDASKSGVLETLPAEDSQLEGAWLFLLEERRLHPIRKKRVKECAHALGGTARWRSIFRESTSIRDALFLLDADARMELLQATSSEDLAGERTPTPKAKTGGFAQDGDGAANFGFTSWSDDRGQEAKAGDSRNPFANRDMPADRSEASANMFKPISPKGDAGRATLQAAMAPETAAGRNPFRTVPKVNGGSGSNPFGPTPGGASGATLSAPGQCRQSGNNPFSGSATAQRQSGNNPFSVQAQQQRQQQQQQPMLAKGQPGPTANYSGNHQSAPWPCPPSRVPTAIDSGWA